jgi:hypothetical protein
MSCCALRHSHPFNCQTAFHNSPGAHHAVQWTVFARTKRTCPTCFQLFHYLTIRRRQPFASVRNVDQFSRRGLHTSAHNHICPLRVHISHPTPCLRISLPNLVRSRGAIPRQTNSRAKVRHRHHPAPPPSNPTIRLPFSARPFRSRLRHKYRNSNRKYRYHSPIHHGRNNGHSIQHRSPPNRQ